jgi:hypothetical protein
MINIASVSFYFDQVEDRIRLIGNLDNPDPRADFWLTRRLVIRLLDLAMELIQKTSTKVSQAPTEHKGAMAQFEHDSAQPKPEQVIAKQEDHSAYKAEILRRMDISYKDGRYRLTFFTHETDDPVAVSTLSYQELHQTLHWLHRGSQFLEWGVSPSLFAEHDSSANRLQ